MLLTPLLFLVALSQSDDLPFYGEPSATVWGDQLFVAVTTPKIQAAFFRGWGVLYRGPFNPKAGRVRSPLEHGNPHPWGYPSTQAQLEIRGDRLLLCSGDDGYFIFPLEMVPFQELSAFGAKLRVLRDGPDPEPGPSKVTDRVWAALKNAPYYAKVTEPYKAGYESILFPDHRKPDVELSRNKQGDDDKPTAEMYFAALRYSVQIAGPKSVRLFHAYKDKLFVSVEPDYINWYLDDKGKPLKNAPKPPERQLRTGKLPADFTEHFVVYTAGGKDYFVTDNGKVYLCAPKGKTEVEVSAVWNDPKQAIVGVVQDLANDAVYGWGFVTDSAAPERFYVRLEPKPVAKPYKLTVPLWNERADAYLESYECARAFRTAADKKK